MVATLDVVARNIKMCLDFLFNKPDLLTKWIKFDNRSEWKPIKNSIVCIKYFKDDVIKNGKRMK